MIAAAFLLILHYRSGKKIQRKPSIKGDLNEDNPHEVASVSLFVCESSSFITEIDYTV